MAAEAPQRPRQHPWLAAAVALPSRSLMAVVRAYRLLLKPWLGNSCRFEPSCSAYTLQALQRHGASGGVLLGGWRLLRCQPWCEGGCDAVPDHHPLQGLFTRFIRCSAPPAAAAAAAVEPLAKAADSSSSSSQSSP